MQRKYNRVYIGMKKYKKEIKQNIKHQFFYLPYPTFLVNKVINDKTKYICFIYSKFFPTKSDNQGILSKLIV